MLSQVSALLQSVRAHLSGRMTRTVTRVVKSSFADQLEERSAALAFHVILALVPMLFLLLLVGGVFLTDEVLIGGLTETVARYFNVFLAEYLATLLGTVQEMHGKAVASIVSLAILLFGASRSIYHLRNSLEFILLGRRRVAKRERSISQIARYVGAIATMAVFLLLVLTVVLIKSLLDQVVHTEAIALYLSSVDAMSTLIGFALVWIALAVVYRLVAWDCTTMRARLIGSAVAAIAITLLNEGFSLVLADATVAAYGVASSLVALMLWSYYVVMMAFVGAEIVKVMTPLSARVVAERDRVIPE